MPRMATTPFVFAFVVLSVTRGRKRPAGYLNKQRAGLLTPPSPHPRCKFETPRQHQAGHRLLPGSARPETAPRASGNPRISPP